MRTKKKVIELWKGSQPINEDDLNDLHQDIPRGRPSCGLEAHSERVIFFPGIDIKQSPRKSSSCLHYIPYGFSFSFSFSF